MKIGVIGATGKAGSLIAREAAGRGHEVTAIIRPGSAGRLEQAYEVLEREIHDIKAADLKGFDAVVNAFGTSFSKPGNEYEHQTSMESLIREMETIPEVRLLCVGGASSLWTDESMTERVLESIPIDFRAGPENQFKAFEKLKASKVNWTYLSPPKNFDSGGGRSGKYMQGTDFVILNSSGESYASYADYAVAMVDEIENKAHIRRRFTIVSDSPFFHDAKRLYSIAAYPFFRAGSYLGVYTKAGTDDSYGSPELYFGSRRGLAPPDGHLMDFAPAFNGKKVPCAVQAKATELTVRTRHGNLYICFGGPNLLLIKGDRGMGLRLRRFPESHKFFKSRGENSWESMHDYHSCVIYRLLKGKAEVNAPWSWEDLNTPRVEVMINPGEDGTFLLAVEEFPGAGFVRDSYPGYAESLEKANAEWKAFLETIPHFPAPFEEEREKAAYAVWSHLVGPAGFIKRPLMYMFSNMAGSSWQQAHNAVALGFKDLKISTELLLNPVDQQSEAGQFMDIYNDTRIWSSALKPPVQGWALKLLMKKHDLAKEIPHDKLETLYRGITKWGLWYFKYRDDDRDGIPQYDHGDESGTDDGSGFSINYQMDSPDLLAYLALLFEASGDLAKILGKSRNEADDWYGRSKDLIDKLVGNFWDGERFVLMVAGTHEKVKTDSCINYLPIVLGKRLPQEIIDKMAADLAVEGDFLTPYGLASEKLSSDDFALGGHMAQGYVLPSTNMLICTGLFDAGKTELAKKIAARYCRTIKDGGFIMLINPFKGIAGRPGGSWAACAYLLLADLLSW
ncbi:MAG: NAD(P)H-binding protein [Treponema sp.]|jgi:putative NADH-flavin reductase|nr:NAD(P)H-binding protein [Treponema sp.]